MEFDEFFVYDSRGRVLSVSSRLQQSPKLAKIERVWESRARRDVFAAIKVLQETKNRTPMVTEIQKHTGLPLNSISKYINDLVDAGLVAKEEKITDKGKTKQLTVLVLPIPKDDFSAKAERNVKDFLGHDLGLPDILIALGVKKDYNKKIMLFLEKHRRKYVPLPAIQKEFGWWVDIYLQRLFDAGRVVKRVETEEFQGGKVIQVFYKLP